jgi:hypothetical protein
LKSPWYSDEQEFIIFKFIKLHIDTVVEKLARAISAEILCIVAVLTIGDAAF